MKRILTAFLTFGTALTPICISAGNHDARYAIRRLPHKKGRLTTDPLERFRRPASVAAAPTPARAARARVAPTRPRQGGFSLQGLLQRLFPWLGGAAGVAALILLYRYFTQPAAAVVGAPNPGVPHQGAPAPAPDLQAVETALNGLIDGAAQVPAQLHAFETQYQGVEAMLNRVLTRAEQAAQGANLQNDQPPANTVRRNSL